MLRAFSAKASEPPRRAGSGMAEEGVLSFGKLLRRHRLVASLTQEELAARAGLSAPAITKLETGERRRPHPHTVRALATALGLAGEAHAGFVRAARPQAEATRRDGAAAAHNLPLLLTSFVGREREIADVRRLLGLHRLLTLTGPGGCGKTRLALQVAEDLVAADAVRVWLVELASLGDPSLVPQTVATALGVREEPDQPILATLESALRDQHLLLLLDNCEHLVAACARLAERLLLACPRLRILATSREALRIAGETVYLVPPLRLPDPSRAPDLGEMARTDAIRLFLDRAASVQPTFRLTSENAVAVVEICRKLDGIPLAIELAATYLRGLPVAQLAARLDTRIDLLRRGDRTADPRHRTLRALVDWSYNLLGEQERALFARLAVFAGGFTLPAAEAISAADVAAPEVLQILVRLIETSLVVADDGGERYHLLETLREYAGERLEASGLADTIRCRHAAYYLALAEDAAPRYGGTEHDAWRRQFVAERDNLRAALAWLRDHDPARALRLASLHERFWYVHGYTREGQTWLETLLDRLPERAMARAHALLGLTLLHELQLEIGQARGYAEEGLALSRALGDRAATMRFLHVLGSLAIGSPDSGQARALLEESLGLAREAGSTREVIDALRNLGLLAMIERDFARARAVLDESMATARDAGDRFGIAAVLGRLGALARLEGDYPRARVLLEEGIAAARSVGHRPATGSFLASRGNLARCEGNYAEARAYLAEAIGVLRLPFLMVTCLASFGVLAVQTGATARGVRLIATATRHDPTLVGKSMPELPIDCQESLPRARAALGDRLFRQAWAEGEAMTLEQAVAYALEAGAGG